MSDADTLIASLSGMFRAFHCASWAMAWRSTQSLRGRISAVFSARGTNSAGLTKPSCGCRQRSSASTPVHLPVGRSIFG